MATAEGTGTAGVKKQLSKQAKLKRQGVRRATGFPGWLIGVLCGVLLAAAPAYALLLGGFLLPGLATWAVARQHPGRIAQTMLLFGSALTVNRIRTLWESGGGLEVAGTLLADPLSLAMAWFAAAFGWALTELLPLAVGAVLEIEAQRQSLGLRRARRQVREGWRLDEGASDGVT